MYRLNLTALAPGARTFDPWPSAVFLLLFVLGLQSTLAFWQWLGTTRAREETARLQDRLAERQNQIASLPAPEEARTLAGALTGRNVWLENKNRSPACLLAALERNRPAGALLQRFDAGLQGGSLKIEAADMETVMRWLNPCFAGMKGKTTVEKRSHGRLSAGFTWTE